MPVGWLSSLGGRQIIDDPKPGKAKRRAASKRARSSRKANRRTR